MQSYRFRAQPSRRGGHQDQRLRRADGNVHRQHRGRHLARPEKHSNAIFHFPIYSTRTRIARCTTFLQNRRCRWKGVAGIQTSMSDKQR